MNKTVAEATQDFYQMIETTKVMEVYTDFKEKRKRASDDGNEGNHYVNHPI
jgi:hypothetical protein